VDQPAEHRGVDQRAPAVHEEEEGGEAEAEADGEGAAEDEYELDDEGNPVIETAPGNVNPCPLSMNIDSRIEEKFKKVHKTHLFKLIQNKTRREEC
jgi:hypothetical protein